MVFCFFFFLQAGQLQAWLQSQKPWGAQDDSPAWGLPQLWAHAAGCWEDGAISWHRRAFPTRHSHLSHQEPRVFSPAKGQN